MDKCKHETYKNSINAAACEHFALSQQGADTTNVKHKLIGFIFEYLSDRHKYSASFKLESDLDILDVDVLVKFINHKIEKWAPGEADFFPYFIHFFYLRIISEFKKKNLEDNKREITLTNEDGDTENEDRNDYMEDISDDAQTIRTIDLHSDITTLFSILNELMILKKKEYENSPKFCYPTRFFTEHTTMIVSELGLKSAYEDIPAKTLDIIDKDFVVFYLNAKKINSIADIFDAELRPLSDFTMTEADRNEKCGYALKNVVYRKYVSMVKGKDVSDSAVSQQRKLFEQILGQIRREKLNR